MRDTYRIRSDNKGPTVLDLRATGLVDEFEAENDQELQVLIRFARCSQLAACPHAEQLSVFIVDSREHQWAWMNYVLTAPRQ